MEIKDILNFDDAKFAQFDGDADRINLGLADAQGKAFNRLAKELDISPLRLLREAIAFCIDAYTIDPEPFIEASRRAHERAAEAMLFAAHDMKRRQIGPTMQKAADGEGYPTDRIHESEVTGNEKFDQVKTKKGKGKA